MTTPPKPNSDTPPGDDDTNVTISPPAADSELWYKVAEIVRWNSWTLSNDEATEALMQLIAARDRRLELEAHRETAVYIASMTQCPLGDVCSAHKTHDLAEFIAALGSTDTRGTSK